MNQYTDNPVELTSRSSAYDDEPRRVRRRSDLAYDHVKRQLMKGRFPPGAVLPVERFATDLEMSRQPVMEAMKRLAGEGFISIIPQVGCQTIYVDAESVSDHFRLFAATEGLLAELAAERWQHQEIVVLQETSARICRELFAAAAGDAAIGRYRRLNRQLHENIHAMARATSIADIARQLADLADFYIATMTPTLLQPRRAEMAQDEHEVIVDLILRRDTVGAGKAMTEHILHFGRHVRDDMKSDG